MKKKILIVVLVLILLAGAGTGIFFLVKHLNKKETASNHIIGISNNPNIVLDDEKVPIFVDGKNVSTIVNGRNDVYAVLDELKDLYGFESSKDVFNIISDDNSADFNYYKVRQKYNNIEIYGKEIVVTVKDKEVINVVGHYYKDLKIDTEYKKSESDIKKIIDDLEKAKAEDIEYKIKSTEKKIYFYEDKPYLVYVVDVYDSYGKTVYFVSGVDGKIIDSYAKTQGEKYVYTGIGLDEKEHKINLDKNLLGYQFKDPERNIVIEDGQGIGTVKCRNGDRDWLNILTYVLQTSGHNPITTNLYEDKLLYGYNTPPEQEFIKGAISTMANYEFVYDYYKNLGRKSFDNKGSEIYILLGAGNDLWSFDDLDNAYWDGEFFVIGNHNNKPISMALDVVAHEYTHAVIQYTAGLVYKGESGALNEGYADIMGNLIEGKNFEVGEGADFLIRDMADPNKFKQPKEKGGDYYFPTDTKYYDAERQEKIKQKCIERCIDLEDWKKYDNGGVHINSGVPNHAAYLMYENGAFSSREEMAKIWFNSLFMLTSNATFEDTALAVMATAKNFGLADEKIDIIKQAFIDTKMLEIEYVEATGKVVDKDSGDGIANVKVEAKYIKNTGVSFTTYTNNDGEYKFSELTPDEYSITYSKAGYKADSQEVEIDKSKELDKISLESTGEKVDAAAEVVFVIDISASMEESDPTYVRKQIIANLVSSMDDSYRLAVVSFKKSSSVVSDGIKNEDVRKGMIMTDVYNLVNDDGYSEDSGTNGKAGLTKALKLFSSGDNKKYIVFLTDGADNDNSTEYLSYEEIIEKAQKKDIKIISVGLGTDLDATTLKKLADETKGKYFQANSSTKLHQFNISVFD